MTDRHSWPFPSRVRATIPPSSARARQLRDPDFLAHLFARAELSLDTRGAAGDVLVIVGELPGLCSLLLSAWKDDPCTP